MITEKINTSRYNHDTEKTHERETTVEENELRDVLLETPEGKGSFVRVPEGTVAVNASSDAFDKEALVGCSAGAEEAANRWRTGESLSAFGPVKVARFDSLVTTMRGGARMDKETGNPLDMTLLYDRSVADTDEGEIQSPSAVLVHEELTPERIAALRAELPPGVPMLDAKTNELLDDVGFEQRMESRRRERVWRSLGNFVLRGHEGFVNVASGSEKQRDLRANTVFSDFDWVSQEDFNDMNDRFRHVEEDFGVGQEQRESTSYYSGYDDAQERTQYDRTVYPESDEVRQHRERVEKAEGMLNEAAAKYGASRWQDLDSRDQERVRRQVLRDVHPDREGGDKVLFQEVEFMTKDIQKDARPDQASEPTAYEERPAESAEPTPEPTVEQEPAQPQVYEPLQIESAPDETSGDDALERDLHAEADEDEDEDKEDSRR